jgi:hypothetical protein
VTITPKYATPFNAWVCVIDGFVNHEDDASFFAIRAKLYQITDLH